MMVASTIVPPAFAGAGSAASTGRAPSAPSRSRRTMPWRDRAAPASVGTSTALSRPAPGRGSARSRQSRATPGCRTAHPPAPRPPAHTIAAKSRSAASAPARSAAGRAHPSDRAAAVDRPAEPEPAPAKAGGTTCSISAKNRSRRVCFFLPAYSACEKLPWRCIFPPRLPDRQILPDANAPNPAYFSVSLRRFMAGFGGFWGISCR